MGSRFLVSCPLAYCEKDRLVTYVQFLVFDSLFGSLIRMSEIYDVVGRTNYS